VNGRSLVDVTHAQALAVFKAVRHDMHVTIRLRRRRLVVPDGQQQIRQLQPQTRLRLRPSIVVNDARRDSACPTSSLDVPRPDYDEGDDDEVSEEASEEGPTSYVPKHGLAGYGDARNLPRGPTTRHDRAYSPAGRAAHSNYYDYDTTRVPMSSTSKSAGTVTPPKKQLRFAGETRYFYA